MSKEELVSHARLASIETLIVGMAHEIGNSNSTIGLNLALIAEAWQSIGPILEQYYEENGDFNVAGISYSEMRESIFSAFAGISEGAKRTQSIVQVMKEFADPRKHDARSTIDINSLVEKALALVKGLVRKSSGQVEAEYGAGIPQFDGDFQRIQQAVIHVVEHICEKRSGSRLTIRLRTRYDREKGRVVVEIADKDMDGFRVSTSGSEETAAGIERAEAGSGGGSALSAAAAVIGRIGGTFAAARGRDGGTVYTVTLPTAE